MISGVRDGATTHLIGLIKSLGVSVDDLLRVTRERIQETQLQDARTLTEFLENRAASKDALIAKAAGEAVTVETVCTIWKRGKAAVHRAKDEGRLLAYKEPGKRTFLFPVFQFDGSEVAAWIPKLIGMVGNGFAALHFLTVKRDRFKGESFLTRIQNSPNLPAREAAIASALKVALDMLP